MLPAPNQPLENVATQNIFWEICDDFFFLFGYRKSWQEVPILFQNLRSELVYTFEWTKSVARLWRNQICEWTLKKKNPPTYQPIGEMEGREQETNIFLRVALSRRQKLVPRRFGLDRLHCICFNLCILVSNMFSISEDIHVI